MQVTRQINQNIVWVGADDRRLALFENLFPVPRGVSYNSYLILDEKTALLDTADESVRERFLGNVSGALCGRELDYLIVNHMEPDHCAGIAEILRSYPGCKMVGNAKTFQFFEQMYHTGLPEERKLVVAEGDTLSLGAHTLRFVMAPMVHWPEVMMSYEETERILFSADAFGTFGALCGNLFADELGFGEIYLEEARRYYTNIVGKYGPQVQAVLKKAGGLSIDLIAPLHGPVWRGELMQRILETYELWSSYRPEKEQGVAIFYGSMYGNTQELCEKLACVLGEKGLKEIRLYDVSVTDLSLLVAESFRCGYLVFAAPTYNGGLYPKMKTFLDDLAALGLRNRKCTVLGNGTWAPQSERLAREILSSMKGMDVSERSLSLKSSLAPEEEEELEAIAEDILHRI